jgi:hypothetical protein
MEVAVLFEAFYNNNNNNTPWTHKGTTTEDEVGIYLKQNTTSTLRRITLPYSPVDYYKLNVSNKRCE